MKSIELLLNQVIAAVKEAEGLLNGTDDYVISTKSQGNYVTSLDIAVENFLKKRLIEILPESGVIAEESAPEAKNVNWVIDPIDGTGNLIAGFPYAISVALVQNSSVLLGVVYCVTSKTFYYAAWNHGAYRCCENMEPERLVVHETSDREGVVVFGMPYDRQKTHAMFEVLERLYAYSADVKRIGPSSLDICSVAEGRAKLYVEFDLQLWDYAAAKLILEEAGGCHIALDSLQIFASSREQALKTMKLLSNKDYDKTAN